MMEETERLLWPDDSARALGKGFGMALAAAQHAIGKNWRESPVVVDVVTGVVRELMTKYGRPVSLFAGLAPANERVPAATAAIMQLLAGYLDETMPPLPKAEPETDMTQWTKRSHIVTTFRDRASREVLEVVHGPEFDASNPHNRPEQGPEMRAAMDRFRPRRESVDIEISMSYAMKDGTSVWDIIDKPPQAEEPAFRSATPDEIAGMVPARGQLPPEIGDRAAFDDAVSGLPLVQAEKAAEKPVPETAPTRRKARAKTKTEA